MLIYQHARQDQRKIALTFDDGPNALFTPKILEILEAKHVRATFFMIGQQVEAEPEVVTQVLAAGHVIGNHTYSHPDARKLHGQQLWRNELERAEQAIQQVTGHPTSYFRIPYLRPISDDVHAALDAWLDKRTILYSDIWSYDWTHSLAEPLSPQTIMDNIVKNDQLGPGSILLFHDGSEADERRLRPERMFR